MEIRSHMTRGCFHFSKGARGSDSQVNNFFLKTVYLKYIKYKKKVIHYHVPLLTVCLSNFIQIFDLLNVLLIPFM